MFEPVSKKSNSVKSRGSSPLLSTECTSRPEVSDLYGPSQVITRMLRKHKLQSEM